jgi:hypothetical protein
MKTLGGVILFTGIEVVTLALWLVFALKPGFTNQAVAIGILVVGLGLEHLIATNVGRDRPRLEIKDPE